MNKPLISVIVPVYNVEKYVGKCIKSILEQTFKNFELIVVNDGSQDESQKICEESFVGKESFVKLVNIKRGGVSKARNVGLDEAKGEWIYFVDSDDYLGKDHLQNYADHLDADIIFQGYRLFNEVNDATLEIKRMDSNFAENRVESMDTLCAIFEYGNFFGPTWNKIFRADILRTRNIRFDETLSFREDELFTFEYCQYVNSVRILPTSSYNYRKTSGSLMRRYNDPKMVYRVVERSYSASLQLPLTKKFRELIEEYYTNSLSMLGWTIYDKRHLQLREFRLEILKRIEKRNSVYPTMSSKRAVPFNVPLSDYYHLIRRFLSCLLK